LTIVVLLFLAGIWGVVLYGWFRDRLADTRPADSIGSFRHQLSVLERTGPTTELTPVRRPAVARPAVARPVVAARRTSSSSPAKRRRDILFGLLAVMGGSLVLSFVPGLAVLRLFHFFVDALCVAYLGLLIRQRNIRAEREMKLRFLPTAASGGGYDSPLLLRRTGN
jgi:hypothetical protein